MASANPTGTQSYQHYLNHNYAPLKAPVPVDDLDPELDEEEILADLDILADLPAEIPTNQALIVVVRHESHFHILGHPYLLDLITKVKEQALNPES